MAPPLREHRAEEEGVVMSGRGSAPPEDSSSEERREEDRTSSGYNAGRPLRGRLMVGRLTLDQVVKVRVLAPQ
jgi:hypothetical protein